MKIAIIGTGGIGGYFGGRLAQAGHDVRFLARGSNLEAIRAKGLQVKSPLGDFCIYPATVTDTIAELGTVDLVLICLKAWQVADILNDLHQIVHKDTWIIPLQNGVQIPNELHEGMKQGIVLGGLCRIFSMLEAPGVVYHKGIEPTIIYGEWLRPVSIKKEEVLQVFRSANITARFSDDIRVDMWNKFIGICTSGLLAVTRTTYGECRELPQTRILMTELMQEIRDVGMQAGIHLKPDVVERCMEAIDAYPHSATSSLTRDVWEGKPSEIEYQNGSVVRLGLQYGVPTPVNAFIYHCILPMEQKARQK